jgi:beta-alanine--pyruvate transaminase
MGQAETNLRDKSPTTQVSLDEYWMPFTPNREFKSDPKIVVRAEGMYYWSDRGHKIIDASSACCCAAGQRKERRVRLNQLPSSISSRRFCAPPEVVRARGALWRLTPGPTNRIFFVSRNQAVDTAMSKSRANYHRGAAGDNMFVSARTYYAVNFGGVSLAGMVSRQASDAAPVSCTCAAPSGENTFVTAKAPGAELLNDLVRFVGLWSRTSLLPCFSQAVAGSTVCWIPPKGYRAAARSATARHPAGVRQRWLRRTEPFPRKLRRVTPFPDAAAQGTNGG